MVWHYTRFLTTVWPGNLQVENYLPALATSRECALDSTAEINRRTTVVPSNLWIVGIGASAGGVEALEAFFKATPSDNGMAFVVVTHLDPNRESMLPDILGRATRMPVVSARDGDPVEAQHVYVLPSGAILTIREGRLSLRRTTVAERQRTPIDVFLTSLAEDQAEQAIGVVLSGGGSDGALGLKAIKEHRGLTIVQGSDGSGPRFSEMPSSAVAAGFVDLSLPVAEISTRLVAYVRNFGRFDAEPPHDALSEIYSLLRARTGHDFSAYKDTTFQRRVQRRMQVSQTATLGDYVEGLRKGPDEVIALFRDLLIGVTDFFRDSASFRALESLVVPNLFEGKGADDEVRVWVAGCATGEEAYSIAILLREHMDKSQVVPKVQIFATDIDETAMGHARAARYLPTLIKHISPGTAEALFRSRGRELSRGEGVARHVHLLQPQYHPRSAVFASRPDLLPQFADLSKDRASVANHTAVPLCHTAGRLPVPRVL
jgi:two-component system, chemotaxis family, CheB/CheR fusion protein